MPKMTDNLKGAAMMVASMTAFTVNDAFMKALADELPLFQALFLRGLGVVCCLAVICIMIGQMHLRFPRRDWGLIVLRSLAEMGGAFLFLTALFNMPLANVSAILQALPLTVSLAGAIFLGEALGWRRLSAILVGFAGVMLIVQPGGAGFSIYSLAALGAVACVTVRDLAARQLSAQVPSIMAALVAAIFVTCGAGGISAFIDWAPLSTKAGWQLAGSTLFILGGYVFSVATMRVGEVSFVAPFRYTSLLVALALGLLVFGDLPNSLTLMGAAIVVATGLFTLYRESMRKTTQPLASGRLR